jgi:hypothetical protein
MTAAQASAPAENLERGFIGMILNNLTQTAKVARPDLPLSGNQAIGRSDNRDQSLGPGVREALSKSHKGR